MIPDKAGKLCVIFLAMGGPDSLDDIPEYLKNIFSDRTLIRLPGGALLQKPFAHLISKLRSRKVKEHYALIGGSSPLLKWTKAQAKVVENILSQAIPGLRCYVGMRYFPPTIESTVLQAISDGYNEILFLPMYPQYSLATTGSCFMEIEKVLKKHPGVTPLFIKDFHDSDGYVGLLADYISRHSRPEDTLLFSAHSLPQKFVDEGDPYVEQIKTTAKLAAGDREYFVSFQSRSGPVNWVGPDSVEKARELLARSADSLFIVPISFVCDHIETLYEIDIELPKLLEQENSGRIKRMPMFNDDPQFATTLAGLIEARLSANAEF